MPQLQKKGKARAEDEVPGRGDPDRKRVLNVLAQRRYRERRKAKFAELEAQTKGVQAPGPSIDHQQGVYIPETNAGTGIPFDESEILANVTRQGNPQQAFRDTDLAQEMLDMQLLENIGITDPSLIPLSLPPNLCPLNAPATLGGDDGTFQVPVLSTLRAFTTIAHCLDITNKVWIPDYLHTLPPNPQTCLPPNLQPTTAQITIPHHPFLDALPWPSVREKLICLFSLPPAFRPPIARDYNSENGAGSAILQLLLDLQDHTDGVLVHGNTVGWCHGSELAEEAWEVGESFFNNWWWCLDGRIVAMSNRRRKERGLRPLVRPA